MSKDDKVKLGGAGSAFGAYVKPKLASVPMGSEAGVAHPDSTPDATVSGHKRKIGKISK